MKKLLLTLLGTTLLVGCSLHKQPEHYADTDKFLAPEVLAIGTAYDTAVDNGGTTISAYKFGDEDYPTNSVLSECFARNDLASYYYTQLASLSGGRKPTKQFNLGSEYVGNNKYLITYLISNCVVVMIMKQDKVSLVDAEIKYLHENFGA